MTKRIVMVENDRIVIKLFHFVSFIELIKTKFAFQSVIVHAQHLDILFKMFRFVYL